MPVYEPWDLILICTLRHLYVLLLDRLRCIVLPIASMEKRRSLGIVFHAESFHCCLILHFST